MIAAIVIPNLINKVKGKRVKTETLSTVLHYKLRRIKYEKSCDRNIINGGISRRRRYWTLSY
jgi:hypothetical protein